MSSLIFENLDSKRRVTIQVRGYDAYGNYEGKLEQEPRTFQVKNATEKEVVDIIHDALVKKYPSKKVKK